MRQRSMNAANREIKIAWLFSGNSQMLLFKGVRIERKKCNKYSGTKSTYVLKSLYDIY
ncbi:hypothetical protein BH10BAC3_BH10BAC3_29050 [soil metagenome]